MAVAATTSGVVTPRELRSYDRCRNLDDNELFTTDPNSTSELAFDFAEMAPILFSAGSLKDTLAGLSVISIEACFSYLSQG